MTSVHPYAKRSRAYLAQGYECEGGAVTGDEAG